MKKISLNKAIWLTIAIFALLCVSIPMSQAATADTAISQDQSVSAEDLNVSVPGNFYWLKQAWRGVQRVFTFDPIKKAELDLTEASEQLLKAQQLANQSDDIAIQARFQNSLQNYEEKIANIAKQSAHWQTVDENKKEMFLTKLNDRQIKQQKVLENLTDKVPEATLNNIKQAQEQSLQSWAEAMDKMLSNRERVTATVQNALQAQPGSDLKDLKNLTIISELADQLPTETAEQLWQVRDQVMSEVKNKLANQAADSPLNEYFAQMKGDPISQLKVVSALDQADDLPVALKEHLSEVKNHILGRLENRLSADDNTDANRVLQNLSSGDANNIDLIEELKNKLPAAVKAKIGNDLDMMQTRNLERMQIELESDNQDTASYRLRLQEKIQTHEQIKNMLQNNQAQIEAMPSSNRTGDNSFANTNDDNKATDDSSETSYQEDRETDWEDNSQEELDNDITNGQNREGMDESGSSRK
ncbi:MAG: DUF5667 domain-containing protein [Candidatus Komeilibacteria bacterium]